MAKKPEVIFEHVLPDGRGLRFVRVNTRLMLDINRRALQTVGYAPGTPLDVGALGDASQKETVASCVRGVTTCALKLIYNDARPATEQEAAAGQKPPQALDVEATLAQYRSPPASNVWRTLGYAQLTAEGDDHMLDLFDDTVVWQAVLERIGAAQKADGGTGTDPFRGLPLTRTAP